MDDLTEFEHLWDGTEPGWKLCRIIDTRWKATINFAHDGASRREVVNLRDLLDEFRNLPMSSVWGRLRGRKKYLVPESMGNIEAQFFREKAEKFGLNVDLTSSDKVGYVPISADGNGMLIEDDELAAEVVKKMLAAGVRVEELYPD